MRKHSLKNNSLVVIAGMNNIGLGIARIFKNKDFEIIGYTKTKNYSCYCKYLSSCIQVSSEDEPERLLEILLEIGKNLSYKGFIIPTNDNDLVFLYTNRATLSKYYILSIPKDDILMKILDKYKLHCELIKHSFNSPRTILIDSKESIENISESIDYPAIIKPAFSGDWKTSSASKIIGDQKAIIVNDKNELFQIYEKTSILSKRIIIQEIIECEKISTYSFCSYSDINGKILWGCTTQKLLQYPDNFGTALLCKTVEDEEIYELGRRIVETFMINGITEVEIIRDKRNGKLYIIEINTRHWLQHTIASKLGIQLSLMDYYYRFEKLENVNKMLSSAKKDCKSILWIDEIGFLIYCLKNGIFKNIKLFKNSNRFKLSTFSLNDIVPFVYLFLNKVLIR